MSILYSIPDDRETFKNPVVTLGSFDGVHMGHRRIFSTLLNIARQKSGDAIVITFANHPRKILTPKTPPKILTTAQEKLRAIKDCGINTIIMLNFTREMADMNAADFFNEIILKKLGVIDVVVGYDHAFGKNRQGTIDFLRELSKTRGFGVTRVEPKNISARPVSSTWIRTEIEDGNMDIAADLLGRNYTLQGSVVRGVGRGKKQLGFPTANILPDDPDKVIPKDGVYAVTLRINARERRQGMLNIGTNPTFANTERTIEVNIFGLDNDIYGSTIELEFFERVRDEIKFSSADELVAQLNRDRMRVLEVLGDKGKQ